MSDHERPASDEAAEPPPDGRGRGGGIGGRSGRAGGGPVEPEKRRDGGSGSFLRELPVLLLIALVLAFVLRTFVVQVFYIPSSSMEETLQINDRMVVEKITGYFREPRRGEIWVFEGDESDAAEPSNGAQQVVRVVGQFIGIVPANARDFVKRVVGLPGDEVFIEAGRVYVNGEPLDEPYVEHDDQSDFGPVIVPEDRLFFLGDNRPNSSDSRRSLGFVATEQLVGRAAVIIWPLDHSRFLTGTVHDVPNRGEARDAPNGGQAPDASEGGDARDAPDGVREGETATDPGAAGAAPAASIEAPRPVG